MARTRLHRLARDLGAALLAFLVVFGVGYVAGRATLPNTPIAAGPALVDESTDASDPGTPRALTIPELQLQLDTLEPPAAVVSVTGSLEMVLQLDRGESVADFFLSSVESADHADVLARFTGGSSALTIKAEQVGRDEVRSEGMIIVFTADGKTFNPRSGMCELMVYDLGFDSVRRPFGTILIPWYTGQMVCTDVPELRSGELTSFTVVFEFREHDH